MFEDIDYYKFFTIVVFLIILLFLVEPEKLKYMSYFGTVVLISALFVMWILNLDIFLKLHKKQKWDFYNFNYLPGLVGN